jgi:hypothetical protein
MDHLHSKLPPELRVTQKKSSEVLYHWYTFLENFHTSPLQFYEAVEAGLKARKVPGLEISREEWKEGGVMSQKREYLRLTRERLVFDICAAPFGTGFFFSCRFCNNRPAISFLALMGIVVAVYILFQFLLSRFGFFSGLFVFVIALSGLVWLLRNAVSLGLADLDATLMKTPGIGAVYERFFRKETYYRIDTRLMYLEAVPLAVHEVVAQVTAANGIKLSEFENRPTLSEPSLRNANA